MRQADAEINALLGKKLAILEKISINTKIQVRFIRQRKCKGLLRLLGERGQYLQELAVISSEIDATLSDGTVGRSDNIGIKKNILLINAKQQEIIRDHDESLAAAKAELESIVGDLHRVRTQKQISNSYYTRWVTFSGSQFNQRG